MDNQKLKQILEKEYNHHLNKLEEYQKYGYSTETNKKKKVKHMHKLHQVQKIINELGFTICKCCGRLK